MSIPSPECWHRAGMKTVELYTFKCKGKPKKISRQGLCVFLKLRFRDAVIYIQYILTQDAIRWCNAW